MKNLKVKRNEKKKLKQRLLLPTHCEGTVHYTRDSGALYFKCTRGQVVTARSHTFHTHNKRAAHGGFDPPSRQDMRYLLKGARAGHYVIAHNGIYLVRIKCAVSPAKAAKLLSRMAAMQKKNEPI